MVRPRQCATFGARTIVMALLASLLTLLPAGPANAVSEAKKRDRVADRVAFAINDKRYDDARRFANPRAVRTMRSYRQRDFVFVGRARNDCYPDSPGASQCPGSLRRDKKLRGSYWMVVKRVRGDWRVVEAFVIRGE